MVGLSCAGPPQGSFFSSQDPSWNHRVYRLALTKLSPPVIPFMPLLLKGRTRAPFSASILGTFMFPQHSLVMTAEGLVYRERRAKLGVRTGA